jgi:hypothetical protein
MDNQKKENGQPKLKNNKETKSGNNRSEIWIKHQWSY